MRDVLPCPIVLSVLLLITLSYWFVISFSMNGMIAIMTATTMSTTATNATIAAATPSSAYLNSYSLLDETLGPSVPTRTATNNNTDYQNATTEKPETMQTLQPMAHDDYHRDVHGVSTTEVRVPKVTTGVAENNKQLPPRIDKSRPASFHDVLRNDTASLYYPKICFYGSTRIFFTENTTKTFVKNLLILLRDLSLRSYNEALIAKNKIHVMIPISMFKPHFKSVQDLVRVVKPVIDTYDKLVVDFSKRAHAKAARKFRTTDCEWVVATKLDADDVIFPGFLDWIVQTVIPTLDRGALVGGQRMARLQMGFGHCEANSTFPPIHWPGEAMGQTRVFRRDVFEMLDMPFDAPPHSIALNAYRRLVFRKLFPNRKLPKPLQKDLIGPKAFAQNRAWDAEMENITGIRMVDPSFANQPFGPPSIYIRSPMSSHFDYSRVFHSPRCTEAEWSSVWDDIMHLNGFSSNMSYIYTTLQTLDITVYDICKSHTLFRQFFGDKNRKWFGNATTCEELDTKFRQVRATVS